MGKMATVEANMIDIGSLEVGMQENFNYDNASGSGNNGISSNVILTIVIVVCVILGIVLGIFAGKRCANK